LRQKNCAPLGLGSTFSAVKPRKTGESVRN
jgi:hypothetical protein